MRRYWLEPKTIHLASGQVLIQGEAFHHIFDVCRQEVGSQFEVLGDGSKAHLVTVTSVEKKRAKAEIVSSREIPPLQKPHLVLALSLSRYPVMDAVVEKCVELGVQRIQPFFSDFSFIRKGQILPPSKQERWEKIVISSTQQSGRGELMEIAEACDLAKLSEIFLQTQSPEKMRRRGLFAYEGSAAQTIKQSVAELKKDAHFNDLDEFWIFVGSEGGFSQREVESFAQMGLTSVTLGEQVLRVETACITLLAILKYELGLMSAPPRKSADIQGGSQGG